MYNHYFRNLKTKCQFTITAAAGMVITAPATSGTTRQAPGPGPEAHSQASLRPMDTSLAIPEVTASTEVITEVIMEVIMGVITWTEDTARDPV